MWRKAKYTYNHQRECPQGGRDLARERKEGIPGRRVNWNRYKGGKVLAICREECRPENQIGAADELDGLGRPWVLSPSRGSSQLTAGSSSNLGSA